MAQNEQSIKVEYPQMFRLFTAGNICTNIKKIKAVGNDSVCGIF